MSYETIRYSKEERFVIVTLNRPDSRNAINEKLNEELSQIIQKVKEDTDVDVLIVTGGDKCFCGGGDVGMFNAFSSPVFAYQFGKRKGAIHDLATLEKISIAAVAGVALGGGCELALACDLRIACEDALFGQPEINLGLMPGMGGTQRLPRLIGLTKAKEILLTGDPIDAKEAYRIGLVNKVVPKESLMEEAKKMAQKIASKPPLASKMIKNAIDRGIEMDLSKALEYEMQAFSLLLSTEDSKEGLSAFMEKRRPVYKGR